MAGVGRLLAVAAVSVCMGCFGTGGRAVPVFLPDEQIGCLFEVLGTVTVRGPFPTTNNGLAEETRPP